jgi:hypothetical protein
MAFTPERPMPPFPRALAITRGEIEAFGMQECIDAWQVVHTAGRHASLMDWQLGVMQNLVFGGVLEGEPKVLPGLPKTYSPYGALKGIEK